VAVLVSLTVGLCIWIAAWSLGIKAFDAFLLLVLIVLPAAAWQIYGPYIKKMMGQTESTS
jgi:hypothetical protein